MIFPPEPGLAPVIPPVTVPIVHAKVLDTVAVRVIFVLVTLQIVFAAGLVTVGAGFIATVII